MSVLFISIKSEVFYKQYIPLTVNMSLSVAAAFHALRLLKTLYQGTRGHIFQRSQVTFVNISVGQRLHLLISTNYRTGV